MKYIGLLRGINVGGNKPIDMSKLKEFFESLGYKDVRTYINSGNIFFDSSKKAADIQKEVFVNLKKVYGWEIPALVRTVKDMRRIAKAIPKDWQNDDTYKTDVAYLFDEIDSRNIIDELPVNKEFVDIRYVKGALFWHVARKHYNKSRINKLIGHNAYTLMTIRNVNTARALAQ